MLGKLKRQCNQCSHWIYSRAKGHHRHFADIQALFLHYPMIFIDNLVLLEILIKSSSKSHPQSTSSVVDCTLSNLFLPPTHLPLGRATFPSILHYEKILLVMSLKTSKVIVTVTCTTLWSLELRMASSLFECTHFCMVDPSYTR
jgi:hypothetical protein